jgi:GNAT superfamily N-acetyltransferase
MKTGSREQIDRFWAERLGSDSSLASTASIRCTVQHLYSGVQLFTNGKRLIIASPPAKVELIEQAVVDASPEEVFSVDWLERILGNQAERIVGPAELKYADEATFRSEPDPLGRALSASDAVAYRSLVAALDPQQEDISVSSDAFPAFGAFSDDTLCSVASYEVWEPCIAHIRIATHPSYRRRGFARAAARALAREALENRLILQWRALAWNTNSLRLARSLGFTHYGSTLYVRLRAD